MEKIISINPANNQVNGNIQVSTEEEIVKKVKAANKAKTNWGRLAVSDRVNYLKKALALFKKNSDIITATITKEVGTPITECRSEIEWDWGYFRWFLDNAPKALETEILSEDADFVYKLLYEPVGIAAVITPWNLPFDMFLWGVIPNLLSGNAVVYKAAEECALTGKVLEEIMSQVGLPDGVFSAIHGDGYQGEKLINQDIDFIWFTGSSAVGQKLAVLAARKMVRCVLEMGGSNPAIVFDDADIMTALPAVKFKRYSFVGQTCDAVKRLIIHQSLHDDFIDKLKETVESIVVGDPMSKKTEMGPLVSEKQRDLLEAQVADAVKKGARIVTGGTRLKLPGLYYQPTIITEVTSEMRIWQEETFGPVLAVRSFRNDTEAISMANDSVYGLGAQIYTRNRKKAEKVASAIDNGVIDINGASHFKPFIPFGGNKLSGIGREHGIHGFRELCRIKTLAVRK